MRLVMPRLYVILDAGMLRASARDTTNNLIDAGVSLLQYRDKRSHARELQETARSLASLAKERGCSFVVNDRADIARLSDATGVHVGQEDLGVEQARALVGAQRWVGISTHNREQFEEAAGTSADYIAVGPIFPTTTKQNPDPVVGLELLKQVRGLTSKPIVAIGGITLQNAASVIEVGADSVAVIRDILQADDPGAQARAYIERLGAAQPAVSQ